MFSLTCEGRQNNNLDNIYSVIGRFHSKENKHESEETYLVKL